MSQTIIWVTMWNICDVVQMWDMATLEDRVKQKAGVTQRTTGVRV
jgi:hypothetical protein